jgi:tungstate transport system ATP-binding protein
MLQNRDMKLFELAHIKLERDGKRVLDIPALTLSRGRITAITGPNGSGKTTLLMLLTGLLIPEDGRVLHQDRDVNGLDPREMEKFRRNNPLLLQSPYLFSTTVEKNVSFGLGGKNIKGEERRKIVTAALDEVVLSGMEKRDAKKLSGGESQRVALARALALKPEGLLLDEPMANVDTASRSVIERVLIQENRYRGTSIIFTTHDIEQAYRLADDIVTLNHGQVVPDAMENTFHGTAIKNNSDWSFDTGLISVSIPEKGQGSRTVSIPPESIIISMEEGPATSARNSITGRITGIRERNGSVDVEADMGEKLVARITRASYENMGLQLGMEVCFLFKAEAVRLY